LMPKAFGSFFLRAVDYNARLGGTAFWWVVSAVEEVSIEIYRQMHASEKKLDPLYYCLHRRHLEDEARHKNYAFLMLELGARRRKTALRRVLWSTDLLVAQALTTSWVLTELARFWDVRHFESHHPWVRTLQSCVPLLRANGTFGLLKKFVVH